MADYDQLQRELARVDKIAELSGGWPSVQHPHRRWEYALMLQTFQSWFAMYRWDAARRHSLYIADVGGCVGLTTPLFMAFDHIVSMYEIWAYGNETNQFWQQVHALRGTLKIERVPTLIDRPLCGLVDGDRNVYDAAFCISTLEHIGAYQQAFGDLLSMVRPGGLVFLTTDYAEDEVDHYANANLRAGRMFNIDVYNRLIAQGQAMGFTLFGGEPELAWTEDCRLVNDSGFASLAIVREV